MKRWFLILLFLTGFSNGTVAADENPLSISVLKTERASGQYTYVLFSVENRSDQRFESTSWSCVFLNKQEPVHEIENLVENIPPRGRAVRRIIQDYGGPFDKIECRFMESRPSRCP